MKAKWFVQTIVQIMVSSQDCVQILTKITTWSKMLALVSLKMGLSVRDNAFHFMLIKEEFSMCLKLKMGSLPYTLGVRVIFSYLW